MFKNLILCSGKWHGHLPFMAVEGEPVLNVCAYVSGSPVFLAPYQTSSCQYFCVCVSTSLQVWTVGRICERRSCIWLQMPQGLQTRCTRLCHVSSADTQRAAALKSSLSTGMKTTTTRPCSETMAMTAKANHCLLTTTPPVSVSADLIFSLVLSEFREKNQKTKNVPVFISQPLIVTTWCAAWSPALYPGWSGELWSHCSWGRSCTHQILRQHRGSSTRYSRPLLCQQESALSLKVH